MRIVLVSHHYAPENNTPQRRWSALISRFVAAGHSVHVFVPPPHYPTGKLDAAWDSKVGSTTIGEHGETIHWVNFREHGRGLAARSIDQLLAASHSVLRGFKLFRRREHRPDVVISTAPALPSLIAGWLLAAFLRVPHVAEVRDAWPDLIDGSNMLKKSRLPTRAIAHCAAWMISLVQRRAALVVTTSRSFADIVTRRGVRRAEVVRNGIDPNQFKELQKSQDDRDGLRVLYAGTIGRSQNLEVAIQAAEIAQARGMDIELKLIGAGAEKQNLSELISRTEANVQLLDPMPLAHLLREYEWADTVLVSLAAWQPFLWTVPSKLYEIIALGKHVSAAVEGETAELVRTLEAGDVVTPNDPEALVELWDKLSSQRPDSDVQTTGRDWVIANLNFDELSSRYLSLLHEVVNGSAAVAK